MLKRYKILAIVLTITLLAMLISGCGDNSSTANTEGSNKTYEWKIGVVDPESYYMTELLIEWADAITKDTDGRITCKVFASGQLGSDNDMLQSLKSNTLQVWEGGSNAISAADSAFDAWSLPYLYTSNEHKYEFWDKNFTEVTNMLADSTDLRILSVIDGPNRELTTNKPIYSVSDLKGLKIRVPEIQPYIEAWNALGASPTAMAFGEVFTSLQTGVIEAQENDVLLSDSSSFFDVCKYLVLTGHASYEGFVVVNETMWDDLPDDLKVIVEKVSKDIMLKSRNMTESLVSETLERIVDEKGVTIIEPNDIEEFQNLGKSIYNKYPHVNNIVEMVNSSKVN